MRDPNYKHEYLDKAKVVTLTEEETSSDIEFYSVLEYCTNGTYVSKSIVQCAKIGPTLDKTKTLHSSIMGVVIYSIINAVRCVDEFLRSNIPPLSIAIQILRVWNVTSNLSTMPKAILVTTLRATSFYVEIRFLN